MPDGVRGECGGDGSIEWPGRYLVSGGKALAGEYGTQFCTAAADEGLPPVRAFAVGAMMDLIKGDLEALGIRFDVFTSERALVAAGKVDDALAFLEDRDLVYTGVLEPPQGKAPDDWEPRPQALFLPPRCQPCRRAGAWSGCLMAPFTYTSMLRRMASQRILRSGLLRCHAARSASVRPFGTSWLT